MNRIIFSTEVCWKEVLKPLKMIEIDLCLKKHSSVQLTAKRAFLEWKESIWREEREEKAYDNLEALTYFPFIPQNTLPSSLHPHFLGLFINTYTSPFLWKTFTIPSLNIHLHHIWVRLAINLGDNPKVNHPYIKPNVTFFTHSPLSLSLSSSHFLSTLSSIFVFSLLLLHTSRLFTIPPWIHQQNSSFLLSTWAARSPLLPSS